MEYVFNMNQTPMSSKGPTQQQQRKLLYMSKHEVVELVNRHTCVDQSESWEELTN